MIEYVECRPGDRLNDPYPRAVYRVTFARQAVSFDAFSSFLTGEATFRDSINRIVNRAPSTGLVFVLGDASVSAGDSVGVIDFRVSAEPGIATVANLAGALDDIAAFARVTRIERFPSVPGTNAAGDSGAQQLDAGRAETQVAGQAAHESGIAATLAGVADRLTDALVVAAIIGALYIANKATE